MRFVLGIICSVSIVVGALHLFAEHSGVASENHAHVHHDHAHHGHHDHHSHDSGEDESPADDQIPHDHQADAYTPAKLATGQYRLIGIAPRVLFARTEQREGISQAGLEVNGARAPDSNLYLRLATFRI